MLLFSDMLADHHARTAGYASPAGPTFQYLKKDLSRSSLPGHDGAKAGEGTGAVADRQAGPSPDEEGPSESSASFSSSSSSSSSTGGGLIVAGVDFSGVITYRTAHSDSKSNIKWNSHRSRSDYLHSLTVPELQAKLLDCRSQTGFLTSVLKAIRNASTHLVRGEDGVRPAVTDAGRVVGASQYMDTLTGLMAQLKQNHQQFREASVTTALATSASDVLQVATEDLHLPAPQSSSPGDGAPS